MEAPKPINLRDEINKDLSQAFNEILIKHLDDRNFNEEKIKIWTNNILNEAKEYFRLKYSDYDLFLLNFIYPTNIFYSSNATSICIEETDLYFVVTFQSAYLYCCLYYFFYKKYTLTYNIDDYESEIIQKGYEILGKFLDERKYDKDKVLNYINNINSDITKYILEKEQYLRCLCITEIYENPIKGKYFFKYLSHGKQIYSKIFLNYINESLICCLSIYFFK